MSASTASSALASSQAVTRELASFSSCARFSDLPDSIKSETARAFLNWIGCVLGGCREEAIGIATATVRELGGAPQASIIGQGQRTDIASAAFVNCISSSIQAFDDAHLATVTHPSGPNGAALLAFSEKYPVTGEEFLNAYALGMEITCRLSNALLLPPAKFNVGFYVTGLTAPIGVAVACGNLMKLDEKQMNWAIGLAASQSSGFRATHGTMTAHFRPGHAARSGVWAAMLAAKGFTSSEHALEEEHGFLDVFSQGVDLDHAVDNLGAHFELLSNAYKPYPCGIVIYPAVDACLEISKQIGPDAKLANVKLTVHPLTIKLTGIRAPENTLQSHVSVFHWAAAALLRGAAGLPETQQDCIDDVAVAELRARIEAISDSAVGRDQAIVEVTLTDGRVLRSHVMNARGSAARPMTDVELDAKFKGQASMILPAARVDELLDLCRNVASSSDVGTDITAALKP